MPRLLDNDPVFSFAAWREYHRTVRWYRRQRPSLAAAFRESVHQALDLACENPARMIPAFGSVQQLRLTRFPHLIYCTQRQQRLVVLALWHATSAVAQPHQSSL